MTSYWSPQNETEWQSFLRQSLEFVGKAAELFPSETFQMLFPLLENYSTIYLSLGQIVATHGTGWWSGSSVVPHLSKPCRDLCPCKSW